MRLSLQTAVKNAEAREAKASGFSTEFKNVPIFTLKDKETATVKLLFDSVDELPVIRSHMVQLYAKSGKPYYAEVNCTKDEGTCAFCDFKSADVNNENNFVTFAHDRLVIPLAVLERNGKSELTYALFLRSVNFYTNVLSPYLSRFPIGDPIDITRNGTGTSTTYSLFPTVDPSKYDLGKTVEELKADLSVEPEDVLGRYDSLIKTWTAEQMDFYLNTKQNPTKANMSAKKEEAPQQVTRRSNHHGF